MADRKTFFTGINFRISRKILYFAFIDFLADSNLIFSLFHSAFSPKGNKIRISTFEKNKLMRNKYYYKISLWFSWFPFWHCRFCWNKILLVPDILCLNPMAGKIPVFFIIPLDWSQKMALDEVGFCTLILLLQYTCFSGFFDTFSRFLRLVSWINHKSTNIDSFHFTGWKFQF